MYAKAFFFFNSITWLNTGCCPYSIVHICVSDLSMN